MRAQDGFGLIEVLVSALVVISAALAVGTAFDAAGHASGRDRNRAIAASLAQGDQERMRGMDPSDLNGLITNPGPLQSPPKVMGGVTYTIVSSASAQNDPEATPDCGGDSSSASYLELTSTVTWPNMVIRPVVEQSLVSVPPTGNGGRIVVAVQDRNGDPEQGTTVNLTGTRTDTATTSAKGCVSWDNVPPGSAHVSISRSGYVDVNGNATWEKDVTVTTNRTTSIGPVSYDQAGFARVTYTTKIGATTVRGVAPGTNRLTVTQPGMSAARQFGTPSVFTTTQDTVDSSNAPSLFPFTSSYGFWAGDCSAEDPANNGATSVSARINPGSTPTLIDVPVPPINFLARAAPPAGATQYPAPNSDVWFTPTTAGCGSDVIPAGTTIANGTLPFPGVPYGSYTYCVHHLLTAAEAVAPPVNGALPPGDYKTVGSFTRGPGPAVPNVTADFSQNYVAGTCP
jgi:type II secretory pathway pseudopilin PulG